MTEQSGRRLEVSGDSPWSRPYRSLLHPADPSKLGDGPLYQPQNFSSSPQPWCIACSIQTWEKKCQENEGKEYALSLEEQNRGNSYLRCESCGSHLCNLCAFLFCKKIESYTKTQQNNPAWWKAMKMFVAAAKCKKRFIMHTPSCFSCQHKNHMKLNPVGSTVLGTQMLTNSAIQIQKESKR
jgi:hypothetical protein